MPKCNRCGGTGRLNTYICRDCAGTGYDNSVSLSGLQDKVECLQAERDSLRRVVEHYKDKCPVCHGNPHNVPFRDSYQVLAECPVCKPAREALQALDGDAV